MSLHGIIDKCHFFITIRVLSPGFRQLLNVEKSTNKFVLDDRYVVWKWENSSVVDLGITKDFGRRGMGGGV